MTEQTHMKCSNPMCRNVFKPTEKMLAMKASDPRVQIYCQSCRTQMVNGRIASKMGWVKK